MIVKDSVVVYGPNVSLEADAAYGPSFRDSTTRTDNAQYFDVQVPYPFFGGWYSYDGTSFELTAYGLNEIKEYIKTQAKNKASQIEYAGIYVVDKPVKTDLQSQHYISGMYNTSQLNPAAVIDFVYKDNTWAKLDATAISTLATAVSSHVEACFTRRSELCTLCDGITNLADVSAVMTAIGEGWPTVLPEDDLV